MSAMLAEFFTSPETIAVAQKRGSAMANLVTEIIDRGQSNGEFDASLDSHLAAMSFLSIATAFLSWKVVHGSNLPDEEMLRQLLHLSLNGLGSGERCI